MPFDPATRVRRRIINLATEIITTYKAAYADEMEKIQYDKMIAASQAKLAETTLVPGYTKIYA